MSDDELRLPSIDGLRAFEAVARLGSFERAAELLHVTASAVSKRVGTLEDLLRAPLLDRSGKAIGLTAAGQEYLDQVGAALALLSAVPLHRRQAQRRQRLRVSAPPTFARQILVPHLAQFTAQHPDVDLELVLSLPYVGAARTEADIEVRHGDASSAGASPLMQDAVLPVASPGLLARCGVPRQAADLARLPLLRTPLEPWRPWFAAAGLAWPEPQTGPKFVDLGLTLEAAVSGQGVALARPSLAQGWIASGALRPLFAVTALPANSYYLLPHAQGGAASLFVQWLRQLCESVSGRALQDALRAVVAERP
jgi:LysR family glycine cleavage system transcriptional activator